MANLRSLRWGIIATGQISSHFVQDLILERPDAPVRHIVQAIGSSSIEKGQAFASKFLPGFTPNIYGSYHECYRDPEVDIIYIGTPHALHKQNCLDAIAAGKNVLCEKAFTITAKEAIEVFEAARAKGVFVMEAMWTRHFPLVERLQQLLHKEGLIGDIKRVFSDFGLKMDIASLGHGSRLKNPSLGAGSLLDIGIYSLTWALLGLESEAKDQSQAPTIVATQTLQDAIDIATAAILLYPDGRQGIITSSLEVKSDDAFCRIEGSHGHILVEGLGPSVPSSFTMDSKKQGLKAKRYDFEHPGMGFYWEADAAAAHILAGELESDRMPWSETVRVMKILDEIRRQGGARFPQDEE
ncbi:uncharacterized protein NECHADRAFT_39702 [Fusarium vanettenii 77-13-4]|uniref:D-xylose 1-dehydrogenase (NADP(+), D-xylono-1,5-lactone-forming) n=1 Tax=Fusarium vanettenii (strain ATCC MYA-4622 / CBS 123669 / FGSC 9596 / NRRL 45880 / 77-13-4) TaxID=660122 RepID=C7ZM56_FUSV7|nr:uncharacterized protein NECHADRAFT_39702 [Fusarium vanettenii 77-13-4]EEU34936.1 hypothetical protein NECHADRAFT_39702 [Fusarium vanettenii 77-13-4]